MEGQQRLQRLEHVGVAQVPRRARPVVHDAVVTLGVRNEARILHGIEDPLAVALRVCALLLQQTVSIATKSATSRLRHIQVGNRANTVHSDGADSA